MNIPFSDISYAQGNYDMSANTDQLIAIRMSSGENGLHFDTQGANNYNHASAAGKTIIMYHFAGLGDPTAEANFFIEAVSPFAEGDIYALDHELGQSAAWCETFAQVVFNATGCWLLDYENISLANSMGVIPNCGLWLAAPSWGFNQTITELNPDITYVAQQGPIVNGVDSDMFFAPDIEHVKLYSYHAPVIPSPAPISEPTAAPVETVPTPTAAEQGSAPTAPAIPPASTPQPVVVQSVTNVSRPAPITKSWSSKLVAFLEKFIKFKW